uniref:Uncharacterized protein n=1 Tax=Panagrolaimus sp. JU765 TaxID=591449 RepID=A0AC34PXS3_9BILA
MLIILSQPKIPNNQLGKLRFEQSQKKSFQIFVTKQSTSRFDQFPKNSQNSATFETMISALKTYVVEKSLTFRGISITDNFLEIFLKPFVDISHVSVVEFVSCSFQNTTTSLLQFLQKTSVTDLKTEYCYGSENVINQAMASQLNLKSLTILPVPGQVFHGLTDSCLLTSLAKLETSFLPNCVTNFTLNGVHAFLKLKRKQAVLSKTLFDLGTIQTTQTMEEFTSDFMLEKQTKIISHFNTSFETTLI